MDENKFKCVICSKYYKSYKSLWNHKKRYHSNISSNIPILSPDIPIISPQINNESIQNIRKIDNKKCDYCNKILSSYKNLHRHRQTCKLKNNDKSSKDIMPHLIKNIYCLI